MGHLYLIRCQQFVKVGIADDVLNRLSMLQVGSPFTLVLLRDFEVKNAVKMERIWHHHLWRYRVRGEWFDLPPMLRDLLITAPSMEDALKVLRSKGDAAIWLPRQ